MKIFGTSKLQYIVLYLIYPTVFLVQVGRMFGVNVNLYIHIPFLLLFIFYSIRNMITLCSNSQYGSNYGIYSGNKFFVIYITYVLLSIYWYLVNGLPIYLYIVNIQVFVLPMLFYLWGANQRDTSDTFYKIFFISMSICVLVGIYLYIETPLYYVKYMLEVRQNSTMGSQWQTESNIMERNRFSSFFESSYAISYMGMAAFCIVLSYIKSKRTNFSSLFLYIILLINIVGILFCMQRVAWAMTFIYLIVYFFIGIGKGNKRIIGLGLVVVVIAFYYFNSSFDFGNRGGVILYNLTNRSEKMSLGTAMSERTNQYEGIDLFSADKIMGLGLGSGGRIAAIKYNRGVADCEYIKDIIEFGWVGLIIYFTLIITSLRKVIKHGDDFILEIFIVFYFVVAGIGHNSLNSYYYDYIFWFALGRLNNKTYINNITSVSK